MVKKGRCFSLSGSGEVVSSGARRRNASIAVQSTMNAALAKMSCFFFMVTFLYAPKSLLYAVQADTVQKVEYSRPHPGHGHFPMVVRGAWRADKVLRIT